MIVSEKHKVGGAHREKLRIAPLMQGLVGGVIPVIGLLLDSLGLDSAVERSGAVLVAFTVIAARFSYDDWAEFTQIMSIRLVIMRDGNHQAMLRAASRVDAAANEYSRTDAINDLSKAVKGEYALNSQIKCNSELQEKITKIYKSALTVEAWMLIAGTLIWGFGDLIDLQS